MQKVEGSSPFIRLSKRPANAGLFCLDYRPQQPASTTRVYQTQTPVVAGGPAFARLFSRMTDLMGVRHNSLERPSGVASM